MQMRWPGNNFIRLDARRLSIIVFSLFFSWMLAFPFEGQVLYTLAGHYGIDPHYYIFEAIAAHFTGLFFSGFYIKSIGKAKRMMVFSIVSCMAGSAVFFFDPSILWDISLLTVSLLSGACVAAWSFFLKAGTPKDEKIKTIADGLIYSNILMIAINAAANLISPYTGLSAGLVMLGAALLFAVGLPGENPMEAWHPDNKLLKTVNPLKPLSFLCLFIFVITINSGLMYQVINPAFQHLRWLVSWYWAIPYIAALYIMKNLPRKTNRRYILYVAITMIGLSFTAFMTIDRSAASYLLINTLMLGACGVCDLFWWSILGEMLDFGDNPARILGVGLSANVLGVLLGGMLGNAVTNMKIQNIDPSILALVIVFVILIVLPLLNNQLSLLLKNHVFLTNFSEMSPHKQTETIENSEVTGKLTEREKEIAALLLKGRTYRMIAGELYLSENTVKTHIKNIYSKLGIQSKAELINLFLENTHTQEHSLSK